MSGLGALLKRLEQLGGDVEEAVSQALLTAGKKIQGDAKRLAPVDSGRLRESIVAVHEKDGNTHVVNVGTNVSYAAYVEFGTGLIGERSVKMPPPGVNLKYRGTAWTFYNSKNNSFIYTRGQPARPFLYPAFKQNEKSAPEIVAEEIRTKIRKTGG